jgi:hypothetical protein
MIPHDEALFILLICMRTVNAHMAWNPLSTLRVDAFNRFQRPVLVYNHNGDAADGDATEDEK